MVMVLEELVKVNVYTASILGTFLRLMYASSS